MKRKEIKNPDEYEELESLVPADFKNGKFSTTIEDPPRLVVTKYRQDQPLLIVKVGVERKNWWANWISMNALIGRFGEDEASMVGKKIDLELVKQAVKGETKQIIYLQGSIRKGD